VPVKELKRIRKYSGKVITKDRYRTFLLKHLL